MIASKRFIYTYPFPVQTFSQHLAVFLHVRCLGPLATGETPHFGGKKYLE